MPWAEILRLSWDSQECRRIPNAVTYANVQVVLWPSLVQQAPSYPAALHTEFVCPAVHPTTKNPALGSLKSNSTLVLGQEFWLFHQVQCLVVFLVNVTQLVEYPLFLSHIILLFNFKDFTGVSECASWRIVRVQSSEAATQPTPSFATLPSAFPPGTSLFTLSFYTCLPWTAF